MDNNILKKGNKARDLVGFIDRKGLTFSGGLLDKPTKLLFDGKSTLDLEVIDPKVFGEQILTIINKSETKVNLTILFSDDSSFFKEIPLNSSATDITTFEKDFLLLVPFDKVAHKLVKLTDKYRLVAVNWGMCEVISEKLKDHGYLLKMAIPAFIVPGFDQKLGLTEASMLTVLSKMESLAGFNLVPDREESNNVPLRSVVTSKKSNLPLLVGVFVFLILILAFLIARR